jgi:hypothetical protein
MWKFGLRPRNSLLWEYKNRINKASLLLITSIPLARPASADRHIDELVDTLECPVCLDTADREPIYQCPEGIKHI